MKLREVEKTDLVLEESKNKNILKSLKFNFVRADKENSNKRIYGNDLVMKEIRNFDNRLNKSGIAGQLNHPRLTGSELDKISHVITNASYNPKTKLASAEAQILNTTKGKDLLTLINSGVRLGASMRGLGTVSGKQINDDWKLLSIDLVENPSFGSDTMITKSNLIESGNSAFDEANDDDFDENKFDAEKDQPDLDLTAQEFDEVIEEITNMSEKEFDELDENGISREEVLEEVKKLKEKKFFSLRDSLSAEIKQRFGKDSWIVDYSDSEVVFRREIESENKYQKIGYVIKGNKVVLADGDAEEVERTVQYEYLEELRKTNALLKKKLEPKKSSVTEAEINEARKELHKEFSGRNTPENLPLIEEQLMEESKKKEMMNAYNEAIKWGFTTKSFEQFSEDMKESYERLQPQLALAEKEREQKKQKLEEDLKREGSTMTERLHYEEAIDSGYTKSFREWKKAIAQAKKNIEEDEELQETEALSFDEIIEQSHRKAQEELEESLTEKGLLKSYHKDILDEKFSGSYMEWLDWTREKDRKLSEEEAAFSQTRNR